MSVREVAVAIMWCGFAEHAEEILQKALATARAEQREADAAIVASWGEWAKAAAECIRRGVAPESVTP